MTAQSETPLQIPLARAGAFSGAVARIRASISTKLLVAFLSVTVLMIALSVIGLITLRAANERAERLVLMEERIAGYFGVMISATDTLIWYMSAFTPARGTRPAPRLLQG